MASFDPYNNHISQAILIFYHYFYLFKSYSHHFMEDLPNYDP